MPTNGRRHVSTDLWLMYSAFLYLFIDLLSRRINPPQQPHKPQGYLPVGPTCDSFFIYSAPTILIFLTFFFSLLLSSQVITYSSSLPARES